VIIKIPDLPPAQLSPNSRLHWAARLPYKNGYKQLVYLKAKEAANGWWEAPERARVVITFIVPDKRKRDLDNLIASFKPGQDGIVDAGVIKDDSEIHADITYQMRYEKGQRYVVVYIGRQELGEVVNGKCINLSRNNIKLKRR